MVTSTHYEDALFYFNNAGITNRFDAIISGDMVAKGKPSPDIYIKAAKTLEVTAERCIVLEDSPNGIKAAHAANMIPIMIPDLIPINDEIASLLYEKLDTLLDVVDLLKNCTL